MLLITIITQFVYKASVLTNVTAVGVTQETTVSQETDAALPVLTPADLAMHGATSATEEKSKLVTQLPDVSGVTQLLSADYPATLVSSAASHLSPEKTPEVEGRLWCLHFYAKFIFSTRERKY